jgi:S-methylmethionine-dependent homocysteine/selenocysteine methylase
MIQTLITKVKTLATQVNKKNQKQETLFYETKDKIAQEKNINQMLTAQWEQIKGQYQGAEEMVNNYRVQYQWLQMSILFFFFINVALVVSICRMTELKDIVKSMDSTFFKDKVMKIFSFFTKTLPGTVAGKTQSVADAIISATPVEESSSEKKSKKSSPPSSSPSSSS